MREAPPPDREVRGVLPPALHPICKNFRFRPLGMTVNVSGRDIQIDLQPEVCCW